MTEGLLAVASDGEFSELLPRSRNVRLSPIITHRLTHNKERQNRTFRGCGLAVLLIGIVGFAPSISIALLTGSLWSVSHDAQHTDTRFLSAHAVGAVIWTLVCVVQLCTGGLPKYVAAHRICGYVASMCLLVAMVLAAANELKYATPASILGNVYTLLLVCGASINMAAGLLRARQRRFPEHKDHVLLAIMFSMDPAVHRLAMWTIRFIVGGGTLPMTTDPHVVDPVKLLILGKMPANLILYVVFGWMFVHSRRVNRVTALCTSFNLLAFIGGVVLACASYSDSTVGPAVLAWTMAGAVAMLGTTVAFAVVEKQKRHRESE